MSFKSFADRPLRTREEIAREVHAVSLARGLDELATVIALMTISTEVGAERHGERHWWCPFNRKDPQTQQFAHDSESDDGLSSGYFQQQVSRPGAPGRPWGWGGLFGDINGARKRMTLADSADMFLAALSDDYVAARDNPELAGVFAQRVQRSGFPDRYRDKWDEAWTVLRRALGQESVSPTRESVGAEMAAQSGDPTWLEEVLRPALGDKLVTLDGWQNSGHGDFKDIRGVMLHHTGNSRSSAESIRTGRPDLAGPLANLHIDPDGKVTVVAVGVCWHAGRGSHDWLPTDKANWHMIGIECAWPTPRPDLSLGYDPEEPWPDPQIISMLNTCAALALRLGLSADRIIGHKEWAGVQGKWDPGNIDMSWFRGEVEKAMRGDFSEPPLQVPGATPAAQPPTLAAPHNSRPDRVLLEEIWTALRGPGGNGWPQLGGKSLVDFVSGLAQAPKAAAAVIDGEVASRATLEAVDGASVLRTSTSNKTLTKRPAVKRQSGKKTAVAADN